uniref:Reverse transcriptase zinc-binding domain-containing protein n=1 Tax=Nicotiana tabacum TaxID=4097 RepID=A0A1S4A0G3_TOBAC|nr:PREDICTED: uncharacterized protein LOC107792379 [Nicotiana tabacum]
MDPMQKAAVIQALSYTEGQLPFKYLGVPLDTKKLSILQLQPLITKMVAKITSWTAKKLSYAGRAQLVQTVLFAIQSYWAQLFTLPVQIVKLIEAYCRSYLWSGGNVLTKKLLLAWEKVCLPKSVGGLNLTNLQVWNSAAIAKTYWDLTHKQDKLWIKWIHAYYVKRQRIDDMSIPQSASWMIRKIFEAKQIINQLHRPLDEQTIIIKHIYLQLIPIHSKMDWRCLMFQNNARPKAIFTMWIQNHGRLLTKDRLKRWGLHMDETCVLCQADKETREHLFAECAYANRLWTRLSQWAQVHSIVPNIWIQYFQLIIHHSKGKTASAMLLKMMYVEYIYVLWRERNTRIFEGASREHEALAREVVSMCYFRADKKVKGLIQNL